MSAIKATRLSFVRVGRTPPPAILRPGVEEVSDFLCAHAAGLIKKATARVVSHTLPRGRAG